MDMIYVDSKTVDQIGYDEDAREVHVIFKRGERHYIYSEVTPEVWEQFRHSQSKGNFIHEEFKAKSYSYRQV